MACGLWPRAQHVLHVGMWAGCIHSTCTHCPHLGMLFAGTSLAGRAHGCMAAVPTPAEGWPHTRVRNEASGACAPDMLLLCNCCPSPSGLITWPAVGPPLAWLSLAMPMVHANEASAAQDEYTHVLCEFRVRWPNMRHGEVLPQAVCSGRVHTAGVY